MASLFELANVLRSKNSGPFELTLDVLFDEVDKYNRVKSSGTITKETIATIYHLKPDQIKNIIFFDQALGFKITLYREISSGTIGDSDVYGAQQHAPLMGLEIE